MFVLNNPQQLKLLVEKLFIIDARGEDVDEIRKFAKNFNNGEEYFEKD